MKKIKEVLPKEKMINKILVYSEQEQVDNLYLEIYTI